MFNNGTEFREFQEKNCFVCKKYSYLNPTCSIDKKILEAQFMNYEEAKKEFPYEKLIEVNYVCSYVCKEVELKDEHKHLQEQFDEILKEGE